MIARTKLNGYTEEICIKDRKEGKGDSEYYEI